MIFLFPRWDMLIPWRVNTGNLTNSTYSKQFYTGAVFISPCFFFLNRQDSIPPQYLRHISYFRAPSSTSSANAMLMVQNRLWKLACLPTKWPNGELDSPSRSNGGCCGARHLALLGHPWTLHDCRESVQLRLKTLENSAKQPTAER